TLGDRGGDFGNLGQMPPRDQLVEAADEARWRAGPLRLEPWLGLEQASFVDNQRVVDEIEDDESDFTATVGAGLRGYVKSGSKVVWAAHALPEYVWWQDADEKRGLAGRYGAGLFGYFNRFQLELSIRSEERQRFFSPEVQVLSRLEERTARGLLELEVVRNLWLYGGAATEETEGDEEDAPIFASLDRETDRWEAGVRLRSPRGLSASLGYGEAETRFDADARTLSNDEEFVRLAVAWREDRWGASVGAEYREIEGIEASNFGSFDDVTGEADVLWRPSERFSAFAFLRRDLNYSVAAGNAFLLSEAVGLGGRLSNDRGALQMRFVRGEDELRTTIDSVTSRIDEFDEIGVGISAPIRRLLTVGLDVYYRDYQSNDPEFDRDVTRIGVSVELGEVIDKLQVGRRGDRW
ncbi:MAG: hypothetical protein AAGN46_15285, partial [Acidobacteriota bacterium]